MYIELFHKGVAECAFALHKNSPIASIVVPYFGVTLLTLLLVLFSNMSTVNYAFSNISPPVLVAGFLIAQFRFLVLDLGRGGGGGPQTLLVIGNV